MTNVDLQSSNSWKWLVTGSAGFIGSHLVDALLNRGQFVVGVDDYSTGSIENTARVERGAHADRFRFVKGSLESEALCRQLCHNVDFVLHQAALGSVPRSIRDPIRTHRANVDSFVNLLVAAKDAGVRRVVFASSSSVYGDSPTLPKVEAHLGRPLSPYAVTKLTTELYAEVFARTFSLSCVGLRYFNVFGPRQSPAGEYAAVIPRWVENMLKGTPCEVFGDGETTRDFCYVSNVVTANLLAAMSSSDHRPGSVFNIAAGRQTSLKELFGFIREELSRFHPRVSDTVLHHREPRPGDIRHSLADISAAESALRYVPLVHVPEGIALAMEWYANSLQTS